MKSAAACSRLVSTTSVQIQWLAPGLWIGSDIDVVALVGESRRCPRLRENEEQALGCFYGARGEDVPLRPVIIVSSGAVGQQVRGWIARFDGHSPAGWLETRTGKLLGRVLAHELGHYLLGPGHSAAGLMRQQFDFGDIWADKAERRTLTRHEVEWLASRSVRLASNAAARSEVISPRN